MIHGAAYAVAAILAAWVWLGRKEKIRLIVALDMAGLCVNKQLDLQSLFTEIERVAPYHGGWFEHRRIYQKWFVLGVVAGVGILGTWFIWRYNAFGVRHKFLTTGGFFLISLAAVRELLGKTR